MDENNQGGEFAKAIGLILVVGIIILCVIFFAFFCAEAGNC